MSSNGSQEGFNVQYIRIGSGIGPGYPIYTVISSRNEFGQFSQYSANGSFWATGFRNAVLKYTDEFFENNFLVIIVLEESSGSNRHEVVSVDINGDIVVKRLVPEIGTSDMATWNIIIELDNSFKREQFQVIFQ